MIKPDKFTDLESSMLSVAGSIVSVLKSSTLLKHDELLGRVIILTGESSKENFLNALSFLYALGKLEYHDQIDSFEFKE